MLRGASLAIIYFLLEKKMFLKNLLSSWKIYFSTFLLLLEKKLFLKVLKLPSLNIYPKATTTSTTTRNSLNIIVRHTETASYRHTRCQYASSSQFEWNWVVTASLTKCTKTCRVAQAGVCVHPMTFARSQGHADHFNAAWLGFKLFQNQQSMTLTTRCCRKSGTLHKQLKQ